MADSPDLQELKRLLRAGFSVDGIILRVKGDAKGIGSVEIVKTKQGSKANFTFSDSMVSRGDTAGAMRVNLPEGERFVEITLSKQAINRNISSTNEDVWSFCISMHPSLDGRGNVTLRRFADNGRQIDESKHLVTVLDDAKNRAQALAEARTKVDYKLKTLLVSFLKTRDWGNAEFLPLKQQFFELQTVLLFESDRMLLMQAKVYANNPKAKAYGDLVNELLNALWQREETFIKRCIVFLSLIRFDIDDAIIRAMEQRQHVDDLLQMLAKRTPVTGRQGLPHLLDAYRRYCESLRPFVEMLSDAVCIVENLPPIPPNTGYKKRVALIKSTRFAGIVACLDPDIRHSESHDGTIFDDPAGRVLLTDRDQNGERRVLGEYSYWQVSDMTLELQNGLLVAVLAAFALHHTALLLTTLISPEYLFALLSIDNLAN